MRSTILLALIGVLLAGCARRDEAPAEQPTVTAAQDGAVWAEQIARDPFNVRRLRPSALLGVYTADYLARVSGIHAALRGIEAMEPIRGDADVQRGEDFALLEMLGAALQTDVPDMLNRSPVRATAFDTYLSSLADILRQAAARVERLEQERDRIIAERRTLRRETAAIQRELNTALREDRYALASEIQQRLLEAENRQADTEQEEQLHRSLIRLYEKLLQQGERRILAMRENREVLIAGLRVVDVPGIEPLGILEQGDTRALRRSGSPYQYLFEGL